MSGIDNNSTHELTEQPVVKAVEDENCATGEENDESKCDLTEKNKANKEIMKEESYEELEEYNDEIDQQIEEYMEELREINETEEKEEGNNLDKFDKEFNKSINQEEENELNGDELGLCNFDFSNNDIAAMEVNNSMGNEELRKNSNIDVFLENEEIFDCAIDEVVDYTVNSTKHLASVQQAKNSISDNEDNSEQFVSFDGCTNSEQPELMKEPSNDIFNVSIDEIIYYENIHEEQLSAMEGQELLFDYSVQEQIEYYGECTREENTLVFQFSIDSSINYNDRDASIHYYELSSTNFPYPFSFEVQDSDSEIEEIDSSSTYSDEDIQEKPLVEGELLSNIVKKEEENECCDYFLDESDTTECSSEISEKPLLEGREFEEIVEEESKQECIDFYIEDKNEDAEIFEQPKEAPLVQGELFEEIVEKENEEECFDEYLDESDSEEEQIIIEDKPLIQGQIFEEISKEEEKEECVDFYVEDRNEDAEVYDQPMEMPLVQGQIFEELECKESAILNEEQELTLLKHEINDSSHSKSEDSIISFASLGNESPDSNNVTSSIDPDILLEEFLKEDVFYSVKEKTDLSTRIPLFKFSNRSLEKFNKPITLHEMESMSEGRQQFYNIITGSVKNHGDRLKAKQQQNRTSKLSSPLKPLSQISANTTPQRKQEAKGNSELSKTTPKLEENAFNISHLVKQLIEQPIDKPIMVNEKLGDEEQI